jgi:hypothetical protein
LVETIRIYDRNAMTWDDTNKAAAFVMPKEPAVLMLSNQVVSFVKDGMNQAVDKNLQTAIALHDALRLFGISYVSPPLTSYAATSQDKTSIDSVKFPLETIEYKSGDCSDLAILYASLLESVQVETAFITIPGHIFMAFSLDSSEENIRSTFSKLDEFIFRDGKVWVPVEVTERSGLFLSAWELGAKEWRENLTKEQVGFYPVRKAWTTFEPVNFPGIGNTPTVPDSTKVLKDFQSDVTSLINREIATREADLISTVKYSGGSPKAYNALGILYARFGLSSKAQEQFYNALKKAEYVPSLVNVGNLYYLKGKTDQAVAFYQRAFAKDPHSPAVLLALARVNHDLQNYGIAEQQYEELRQLRPDIAEHFAYLQFKGEESVRAAEANKTKDEVLWEEGK